MAAPPARPKPIAFVCVVRFATPQARNAFYATSGQAGQGAEAQARKMLAALGLSDVELVTWVLPRAKAAKAAGAAAVAGPAVFVFAPFYQKSAFLRAVRALSCCRATTRPTAAGKCRQCP